MPNGFKASGIKAGLKPSGKPDLALLVAPEGAVCAGTFTKSLVRASCIDICIDRLKKNSGKARAVLINSGQANACTGERGLLDSLRATKALADRLGLLEDEILICSTGVIGLPIPIERLICGLDMLVEDLSHEGGFAAANAILTTDLVEKQVAFETYLDGQRLRIAGMAKGSGMIHPNMATMLAYISCDVGLPADVWIPMVHRVVESSFNSISVDGDTSTNDACLAFAAGPPLDKQHIDILEVGLKKVADHLAKSIARDGEGANCLLEVEVIGAFDDVAARTIARTICSSSLVKTAIHGCDPNWGRIIAAAGRAGVDFLPNELSLWIGSYQLIQQGDLLEFDPKVISDYMRKQRAGTYLKNDSISIRLEIGNGQGAAICWGCDLSDQYVRINADYTT